jgi:threonine/homoserine/homoserine lactone efflux protein
MGEAIGQTLPLAVVVALSPIPIVGVVLMLSTPRARVNGPAFIVGWLAGILAVGGAVLAVSGGVGANDGGEPATWVDILKLALGVLLLRIALRQWRGRPKPGEHPDPPKWMADIDSFRAPKAVGLGVLLSAVNPKNLLLVVGAAATIAQTGAPTGDQIGALVIFAAIATLGPAIPVVAYLVLGERSKHKLDELKEWMTTNNAAIMAAICAVIAAKLIGDAISGLSG